MKKLNVNSFANNQIISSRGQIKVSIRQIKEPRSNPYWVSDIKIG